MTIYFLSLLLIFFSTVSCKTKQSQSNPRITSTHSDIYEGSIKNIKLIYSPKSYIDHIIRNNRDVGITIEEQRKQYDFLFTDEGTKELEEEMINKQLNFMFGYLYNSDATIAQKEFEVLNRRKDSNGNTVLTYNGKFILTRSSQETPPSIKEMFIPIDLSYEGLKKILVSTPNCFREKIFEQKKEGEDWYYSIFYYFQPSADECNLTKQPLWQQVELSSKKSGLQTYVHQYPEIDRIWKDKKFVATMIFTPNSQYTNDDHGAKAYLKMIKRIINEYGPSKENINPDLLKPTDKPKVSLTYDLNNGEKIEFHILFWENSWQSEEKYENVFRQLSKASDYISYNGHAGYGQNIQYLEEWSEALPGQYQIFYVNGCSTYAYIKTLMFEKRKRLNNGEPASRHLDLIANVVSSYFRNFSLQNIHFINGIVSKNQSYFQMLDKIDNEISQDEKYGDAHSAKVIVFGEEDNLYYP